MQKIIANKYQILAELGRGGMGCVYKVRHTGLDKIYALKVLHHHLAHDTLIARFHSEARIMASLHHPHIIQVFDIDRNGDEHYFVMEYIDGQTLSDIIKQQAPLPIAQMLTITREIAKALNHAHQQQPPIIHRDIKPANIMLEHTTGRIVVTDFGIAKVLDAERTHHTLTGFTVGTPSYAAPEQLRSSVDLDGRADIFPLGLVMYEMLAGRPLFDKLTPEEIIGQKLFDPREFNPDFPASVPTALQQLILRAMAKQREQRQPDVAALLDELDHINDTPVQPKPPNYRYAVLALLVLALSGYLVWFIFTPDDTLPKPDVSSIANISPEPVLPEPEPILSETPATEPDLPEAKTNTIQESATLTQAKINSPPVIISYTPQNSVLERQLGALEKFQIEAVDPDEQAVSYQWFLNQKPVATADHWEYLFNTSGDHHIKVVVTGQQGESVEQHWKLKVQAAVPELAISPATNKVLLKICSKQRFAVTNAADFTELRWYLDGKEQTTAQPEFIFQSQTAGTFNLQIQAFASHQHTTHNWQIIVTTASIAKTEVENWLREYQQALQQQNIQALGILGEILNETELAELQNRQGYEIVIENWQARERPNGVEVSINQTEKWYQPQSYSMVVAHSSPQFILQRQNCSTLKTIKRVK